MNNQHLKRNGISETRQIESLIAEQDDKLQDIFKVLQIILVDLNDKSTQQEQKEQIMLILQALLALSSDMKKNSALRQEFESNTQSALSETQQENQDLRTYCQQIKQQLKKQNGILENQFSIKNVVLQNSFVVLTTAILTIAGIRLFFPLIDSMMPSKNGPELQKESSEKPVKTPRKSK